MYQQKIKGNKDIASILISITGVNLLIMQK